MREMPSRKIDTMSSICSRVMISGGDITHMLISGLTSRLSSWQCASIPVGSSIRLAYDPEALMAMAV